MKEIDCIKNCINCIIEEINHFYNKKEISFLLELFKEDSKIMKKMLKDNILSISNDIYQIKDSEDFLNLNRDLEYIDKKIDTRYSKLSLIFFIYFLGVLYLLIQLVAVQEMIIILNAILNELIDEIKLSIEKSPRKYNFYEVIKICSYKEIPDIDVALITSFIGIIAYKSLGFIITNIIFQLIPALLFLFFFFIFLFIPKKN